MKSCKEHKLCKLLYRNTGHLKLSGFYKARLGTKEGQVIWVVDGDMVAWKLYPAFIMGGNDQRYRFNPQDEVWLDSRSGVEELRYTLAHELIERRLMRERGWTYARAHKEGIKLEKQMRDADMLSCRQHECKVKQGGGTLPRGIYRQFVGRRQGLAVWIVDGPMIRRELYGDFSMGGHGLKYPFVPRSEIWLDSAMTLEQLNYVLIQELSERKLMLAGEPYADAYELALCSVLDERLRQNRLVSRHEKCLPPVRFGARDRGVVVRG